jgi:hypothetical protein
LGFLLFDMEEDPFELEDLASRKPEVVREMLKGYEEWFRDVSSTRGFDPPRIALGTSHENPVLLSRQDWRGPRAGWAPDSLGHWEVEVRAAGAYEIQLLFRPLPAAATARFALGGAAREQAVEAGASTCIFREVRLEEGAGSLEAWIERGLEREGVLFVEVRRG